MVTGGGRDVSANAARTPATASRPAAELRRGQRSSPSYGAGKRVVGVLALQGSFPLHMKALRRCGVEAREVRTARNLQGISALVVPGGESTVMSLLARKYGIFEQIQELGRGGLPIFGTCAGAILLGRGEPRPPRWELVDIEVVRNAYGTQIDSFSEDVRLTAFDSPFRCVFIRAPKIRLAAGSASSGTAEIEVLGVAGEDPVLVRCGRFLLSTFHPELTEDLRVHEYFLEHCVGAEQR